MFLKHTPHLERFSANVVLQEAARDYSLPAHTGEIIQRPENFLKSELAFPSGEPLPLCWIDSHYYEHMAA